MRGNVLVTVICLAYNHEKYIRKALDGFALQKTNFNFKVIVHDDASTDNTANIIREYEKKYDFICAIYQQENQYSKGSLSQRCIFPYVEGKYVAYCEGDDYWTDPYKLQIMVDFLEGHDEFSSCCHSYDNVIANTEKIVSTIRTLPNDGVVTANEAIMYANPPQLASQIFRREVVLDKPELFYGRGVGDYTLLLYALKCGKIYYINKVMACHRIQSDGSWSQRVYSDKSKKIKHFNNMIAFLKDYDLYTDGKYSNIIHEKINEIEFSILIAGNDYKEQKKSDFLKKCTVKRKIIVYLGTICPKLAAKIESTIR